MNINNDWHSLDVRDDNTFPKDFKVVKILLNTGKETEDMCINRRFTLHSMYDNTARPVAWREKD